MSLINQLMFFTVWRQENLFAGWLRTFFLRCPMNKNEIKKYLNSLCADEVMLLSEILTTEYKDIYKSKNSNHKILKRERKDCCPYCGSLHIRKNGKRKSNVQKYICSDCHKSYSSTYNSILYKTKKSYLEWNMFIECELLHLTLEETAYKVGISKTTAFAWRHKLYKSLENYINSIKLSKTIRLDATYEKINLKGTKPKNMPRMSKKRTSKGTSIRGISHHKVCIITGIDEEDNMVLKIAGLGRETIEHYQIINKQIINPELLITDQAWGYTTYAKQLNCKLDQISTGCHKSSNGNDLNVLNGIHSELKLWLKKYHGVSTRHLQGYLNMFVFKKMLSYKFERNERLFNAYILSLPSETSLFVRNICNQPFPIDLFSAYGEYHYGIFA